MSEDGEMTWMIDDTLRVLSMQSYLFDRSQNSQRLKFVTNDMSSSTVREREEDEEQELARSPKRTKVDELPDDEPMVTDVSPLMKSALAAAGSNGDSESVLPPSHTLLGITPTFSSDGLRQVLQTDVGISEYISRDVPPISGIIKQR